jgi:hypothetical protein
VKTPKLRLPPISVKTPNPWQIANLHMYSMRCSDNRSRGLASDCAIFRGGGGGREGGREGCVMGGEH